MTLNEIKDALANGKRVFLHNERYEVIVDRIGQYLIKSDFGRGVNYIGLTWADGKTLNGDEKDFFVG